MEDHDALIAYLAKERAEEAAPSWEDEPEEAPFFELGPEIPF
jgi:hypothetical protein